MVTLFFLISKLSFVRAQRVKLFSQNYEISEINLKLNSTYKVHSCRKKATNTCQRNMKLAQVKRRTIELKIIEEGTSVLWWLLPL